MTVFSEHFCGEDGCCLDYRRAQVALLPVPYDGTSTWIKGADKGPAAIIEASGALEMYDIPTATDVSTQGIFTLPFLEESFSPEDVSILVEGAVRQILSDNKFPVILGGEHSVSIGAFRAMAAKYTDLTILQLDAHADLRPHYDGTAYNHACAMYQAKEVAPIVQVGIRSMCEEERVFVEADRMFLRQQIRSDKKWEVKALNKLSKYVYITIDLDVFDPSIMPSTGTPEPDGLLYQEVLSFVRKVCLNYTIVGFDVVELCPQPNHKASDFLAAKLVYQLLSFIFINR